MLTYYAELYIIKYRHCLSETLDVQIRVFQEMKKNSVLFNE